MKMLFEDQIECHEAIAEALIENIPEAWDEIRVKADLDGDSINLLVLYRPKGSKDFSGNIMDVPMLARYMFELSEWASTPELGLFKTCIFTVHPDGRYKGDFIY
jgi:hypothetical protein